MSAFATVLASIPISLVAVILLLRYGPDAIISLLAGAVAVLSKDKTRGTRALAVLRLLHSRRPR